MRLSQSSSASPAGRNFNFCSQLVVPQIASMQYSLQAASGFPNVVARPIQNCTVQIETDTPVTGTLVVDVDASYPDSTFS